MVVYDEDDDADDDDDDDDDDDSHEIDSTHAITSQFIDDSIIIIS